MASLEAFLKDQGYSFSVSDKEVRLERNRKWNIVSIVIGIIGMSVFIFIGSAFESAAVLMYLLAVLILFIVLRFNFRGFKPITIFDWTHSTMIKKSVYFFVNSTSFKINGYKGIDVDTVDWSSKSSEGVDEFQKTIYLKTEDGDLRVFDFYTEQEALEPEIKEIMEAINAHLLKRD